MRALFGLDPDGRLARRSTPPREFERRRSASTSRDYFLQILRGPRTPWAQMQQARGARSTRSSTTRSRGAGGRASAARTSSRCCSTRSDEDGTQLDDPQIRDEVMTLLFAGHDTTTSTVAFLFYELARHPTRRAAGRRAGRRAASSTRRALMGGTRCRGSRWRSTRRCGCGPPAWIGPRRSVEHVRASAASAVPGGVPVNYSSWASHRLPDVWDEPDAFRPERFAPEAQGDDPQGRVRPVRRRLAHVHRDALRPARDPAIASAILRAVPARARARATSCACGRCRRSGPRAGCRSSCAPARERAPCGRRRRPVRRRRPRGRGAGARAHGRGARPARRRHADRGGRRRGPRRRTPRATAAPRAAARRGCCSSTPTSTPAPGLLDALFAVAPASARACSRAACASRRARARRRGSPRRGAWSPPRPRRTDAAGGRSRRPRTARCGARRSSAVGGFRGDVRSGGDADLCFRLRRRRLGARAPRRGVR